MTDLEVRELDFSEYKLWDELVENSPHGTIFHTSDWLIICRDTLKKNLKIYGCFQNDELVGGCSLFIKNKKGILKIASSICEMTPYGGLVIKEIPTPKVRKQVRDSHEIMNSLREFLCDQKFDSISIGFSPDFYDIRPFTWNGWKSNVHYAYYVNLKKDEELDLSKDFKKNSKTALKSGVKIKRLKDSTIYYDLFSLTFERQNLKTPVNNEFFKCIIKLLESKQIGDMWVAETSSGEYIAAQIRLWDNKRVYAWTGASNPSYRKLGSNSLLYCDVLKDLKAEEFNEINMMAANTQRFTDFITGLNPKLVPYYSIHINNKKSILLTMIYNNLTWIFGG